MGLLALQVRSASMVGPIGLRQVQKFHPPLLLQVLPGNSPPPEARF